MPLSGQYYKDCPDRGFVIFQEIADPGILYRENDVSEKVCGSSPDDPDQIFVEH